MSHRSRRRSALLTPECCHALCCQSRHCRTGLRWLRGGPRGLRGVNVLHLRRNRSVPVTSFGKREVELHRLHEPRDLFAQLVEFLGRVLGLAAFLLGADNAHADGIEFALHHVHHAADRAHRWDTRGCLLPDIGRHRDADGTERRQTVKGHLLVLHQAVALPRVLQCILFPLLDGGKLRTVLTHWGHYLQLSVSCRHYGLHHGAEGHEDVPEAHLLDTTGPEFLAAPGPRSETQAVPGKVILGRFVLAALLEGCCGLLGDVVQQHHEVPQRRLRLLTVEVIGRLVPPHHHGREALRGEALPPNSYASVSLAPAVRGHCVGHRAHCDSPLQGLGGYPADLGRVLHRHYLRSRVICAGDHGDPEGGWVTRCHARLKV
eukprot:Hpha_TRINITY_DN7714_c0_g1::TRINITY_DN7714_c0_g1_i1::g.85572::m.85572